MGSLFAKLFHIRCTIKASRPAHHPRCVLSRWRVTCAIHMLMVIIRLVRILLWLLLMLLFRWRCVCLPIRKGDGSNHWWEAFLLMLAVIIIIANRTWVIVEVGVVMIVLSIAIVVVVLEWWAGWWLGSVMHVVAIQVLEVWSEHGWHWHWWWWWWWWSKDARILYSFWAVCRLAV